MRWRKQSPLFYSQNLFCTYISPFFSSFIIFISRCKNIRKYELFKKNAVIIRLCKHCFQIEWAEVFTSFFPLIILFVLYQAGLNWILKAIWHLNRFFKLSNQKNLPSLDANYKFWQVTFSVSAMIFVYVLFCI